MPTFTPFIAEYAERCRKTDLRVSVLTERSSNDQRLDEFARAVQPIGIASVEWLTPGRPAYQRRLADGTPMVCCADALGYWQAKITGSWGSEWALDIKDPGKRRVLITKLVQSIETAAEQLEAPGPVIVYGDTHGCSELSVFYADVVAALDKTRFKAARLDEGLLAARLMLPEHAGRTIFSAVPGETAKLFKIQKES
jgi:hypothetical protein